MQVNENLAQEIYTDVGEERLNRARRIVSKGKVEIKKVHYEDPNNFEITAEVEGNYDNYTTTIKVEDGELEVAECECQDYYNRYAACKHIAATLIKFTQTKYWDKFDEPQKSKHNINRFANFRKIVIDLYNEELQEINSEEFEQLPEDKKIKIEPRLIFDRFDSKLKLEIKIGNKRMYKIKDLSEFYTRMARNEFYKYGDKLEFVHTRDNFTEKSRPLLDFVLRYSEMLKYAENGNKYTYYGNTLNNTRITLGESSIDEAFDVLKNKRVLTDVDRTSAQIELIEDDPNITFELSRAKDGIYTIKPNKEIFSIQIFNGKKYTYVIEGLRLYRCSKNFENTVIRLVKIFKQSYITELELGKEDLKDLYSVIMPKVGNCIRLKNIAEEEIEEYKPKNLGVKVYLDFDQNDYVIADVKFCYGNEEFNPLEKDVNIKNTRNILSENKSLNIIRKTGFMVDTQNLRFILPNDDKIYNFLANDIEIYMQKFEVLATENFKSKEIRKPKLGTIGVKVENNLLSIDFKKLNIKVDEIKDVMQKYQLKKKYYRLKDGSFLNLEENEDIEFLDKLVTGMDLDYKDLEKETVKLPINRSLYLNELLKREQSVNASKSNEFQKIVSDLEKDNINDEIAIPEEMENVLRDYQKTGFKWLKVLDSYHFGGILADDMGLGKTLQVISILMEYKDECKEQDNNVFQDNETRSQDIDSDLQNEKERKASIVICPSSLTLNWLSEVNKFAPDLKPCVIKGNAREREKLIKNVQNYDLIITSYDLLKRDIEVYKELNYNFKYIIADEAQYMKNSTTQNAKAIKELNGETRYALTGTPIENSLAELWSIFDFVMPGYLFGYKKFKNLYEIPIVKENDERAMNRLKMLIAPFILRRNKKNVLTELPEKTITVLNNQMTDEQEAVYMSYLAQAKQEVVDEIKLNGFEKSQFKILSTLTRLRQICCHPSLFIKDYKDESSKLNQCVEILSDAIEAGHKILLFSGYTSMFEIIEKELNSKDIKYFKLTGSTKVDERIKLVDEFNSNPDVKIFLISLKAGGTGLNLTGADMVIHYDPWWNQSAENQATDRAYRIGQKNNVQVYKLITSNSIEEKIYELQNKKAELIDNMLDTKTSFVNKLSKDEIMSLFE
ncbi:MAG: SNF2 helicase associated domain-containing protein [Clostridia bacterium]|nr:SNF2 helicase associated domain-containing protein [Clostridia bacterium]